MLPKNDSGKNNKRNNKKKSSNNYENTDINLQKNNAKNAAMVSNQGDLWATTPQSPDIQQGSPTVGGGGRDFGYESYDSRHQLVVVPTQGQTVI